RREPTEKRERERSGRNHAPADAPPGEGPDEVEEDADPEHAAVGRSRRDAERRGGAEQESVSDGPTVRNVALGHGANAFDRPSETSAHHRVRETGGAVQEHARAEQRRCGSEWAG